MGSLTIAIPERPLQQAGTLPFVTPLAGHELRIESDLPLSSQGAGALACAFLLPAMSKGLDLTLGGALDPLLGDNLTRIQTLAGRWWPTLHPIRITAPARDPRPRSAGHALFFTGGVDSSFALLKLEDRVTDLIFVEGFDIKLADTSRLRETRAWLSGIAEATGKRLVVVRTNLREHPLFMSLNWELTHIAALAMVAHALEDHFGSVYVAASDVPSPYGSHPDLDPLWSSASLALINIGSEYSRWERVAAIKGFAALRGRLRVCWQHFATTLNCGHCEKCVRTRLQLLAAGNRNGMDSFPDIPLDEALRSLERTPHELHPQWREIEMCLADPRWTGLIDALLARSLLPRQPAPRSRSVRLIQAVRRLCRQPPRV